MGLKLTKIDVKNLNFANLGSHLKSKIETLAQNSKKRSKKEIFLISTAIVLVLFIIFFYVLIRPVLTEYNNVQAGLERAINGYNFMLQNASKVTQNRNDTNIDYSTSIENAVRRALEEQGIQNATVKPEGEHVIYVEMEDSLQYSKVNRMIKICEARYGITVDELTLDKTGEGIVYVANMKLVRLGSEE